MHTLIIHQSSTGNTLLGATTMAEEVRAAGHECELVRVRDADPAAVAGAEMVGIATAVYGFRPARNMLRFVADLPELAGTPTAVLCCCSALPSNSVRTLWRMLEGKGARVLGGHVLKGEDSWPALRMGWLTPSRGCPSPEGLTAVRAFTREVLARAEDQGRDAPRAPFWLPDPLHLVGLCATSQVLRMAMLGKRVNADKCTRCGKCAELCPTAAITMDDLPQFSGACMGCYGCINNCPEAAISCPVSWGRGRYRGPR